MEGLTIAIRHIGSSHECCGHHWDDLLFSILILSLTVLAYHCVEQEVLFCVSSGLLSWTVRTVKVDIQTVAMMNSVEDRSCSNHGGRWLRGIALDIKLVLMLAGILDE